jgi:hypothetical protein
MRASPTMTFILATQKAIFSIFVTHFLIQTQTNYLFHSLFSLNIIFYFFNPTVFFYSHISL